MMRWLLVVICLASLGSLAAVGWMERKDAEECRGNMKDLSTALEMYATNPMGYYPPNLGVLTLWPNDLRVIPVCPTRKRYAYARGESPDAFTITCTGGHGGYSSYLCLFP